MVGLPPFHSCNVGILGLGYVGLPLAIEIQKQQVCKSSGLNLTRSVFGFDISPVRIKELESHIDKTDEVPTSDLESACNLTISSDISILKNVDIFIVAVPTPIDASKQPDFSPLKNACESIGSILRLRKLPYGQASHQPIIIFESTVYPGATEEICVPTLESSSGLVFNQDFYCGYSPERISPGDKSRKVTDIVKVTSGSTPEVADLVDKFYSSFITAGTYLAPSIKVAEASKVIENTQRDLNIALVNELAIIFDRIGVDTHDVLKAAGTKWNFLNFYPGLVGGHCIRIDPYYLTHKSSLLGYTPQVVLSGRRINDCMAEWIIQKAIKKLIIRQVDIPSINVLILGFTFKEDCPDIRNTGVIDLIESLASFNIKPFVVDPIASIGSQFAEQYNFNFSNVIPTDRQFDLVILAVCHKQFKCLTVHQWKALVKGKGFFLDIKGIIHRELNPIRI